MPQFTYTARDAGGGLMQGVLEGDSAGAVAAELQRAGSTPLEIVLATAVGASMASKQIGFGRSEKVKHEDLLMFSRQLHTLLKAGIALTRALGGLQESASAAMKDVIRQIRESLESGNEMSTSLAKQTGIFSAFYVSMVRVGEMTGRLDEVFLRLFHHLEFEKLMRDQVKSALRYPTFVIVVMLIAIGVINVFVIPSFQKVFDGFGAQLPLMTRILVGFSKFTLAAWPYILVGAVGAIFAFRRWTASEDGGYAWDKLKLKFPIAGKIIRKATLARFSRSFALALKSGVPVVQAMMVVANTVDNHFFARAIEKMREGVERGDSLLRTAAASGIFTPVVLQMIAVGEESGTLDEMLGEVADFYQQEVEYELKSLSAQIEPILIVFLGVLVLILALGVFLPIWDLGKAAIK
ncbi:type II secretion system F family protein [Piscinibacter sp. HJYY11]|uniref:type II secretion system F family protein n=1 Tax=Piscinibacter sp. HJYY11 TaxID=2801333 RepID=UPI00191CC6E9|nr:type II secretion system F family protein [Piscinibacter sp. HJYY11]MBL0727826.1 type II secretion system F family protein [Piscinibacter sp. HJYY11]